MSRIKKTRQTSIFFSFFRLQRWVLLGGNKGALEVYDESFQVLTKKNVSTEAITTIWQTNQRKGGKWLSNQITYDIIVDNIKFKVNKFSQHGNIYFALFFSVRYNHWRQQIKSLGFELVPGKICKRSYIAHKNQTSSAFHK